MTIPTIGKQWELRPQHIWRSAAWNFHWRFWNLVSKVLSFIESLAFQQAVLQAQHTLRIILGASGNVFFNKGSLVGG